MNKKIVLIFLTTIFSLSAHDFIRVNGIDSLPKGFANPRIANLSFSEFSDHELKITKSDSTVVTYPLSRISNITFTGSTGIETQEIINKLGITLLRNYPNPFNPETTINFSLHGAGLTKVEVFNYNGQKVTTLHNGHMSSGNHSLKWNAMEKNNSSGVYFVKVSQNNQVLSNKMLLIK